MFSIVYCCYHEGIQPKPNKSFENAEAYLEDTFSIPNESEEISSLSKSEPSNLGEVHPSKDPMNLEQLTQYGLDGQLRGDAHFARYKGRQEKRSSQSDHENLSENDEEREVLDHPDLFASPVNDQNEITNAMVNNLNEEENDEAQYLPYKPVKSFDPLEKTVDSENFVNDRKGVKLRQYVAKIVGQILSGSDSDDQMSGVSDAQKSPVILQQPEHLGQQVDHSNEAFELPQDPQLSSGLLASLLQRKKILKKKPEPELDESLQRLNEDAASLAASVKRAQAATEEDGSKDAIIQILQKDNRPVEEGDVHVELDESGKHIRHVSPTVQGEHSRFTAIDSSFAFVYVQWGSNAKLTSQQQRLQEMVVWVERQLKLPRGSFSNVQVQPVEHQPDLKVSRMSRPVPKDFVYAITFKVNPNRQELDAHDVALLIGKWAKSISRIWL